MLDADINQNVNLFFIYLRIVFSWRLGGSNAFEVRLAPLEIVEFLAAWRLGGS